MKTTARAVLTAALLSLIASPAFAQCNNMAANTVCGRLAIPTGGGSAIAIPFAPFAAALAPNFGWIRLNTIQNPTTGFGMEMGYDGTEGVIQSYSSRATATLSPIFYIGASHKFTGGMTVQPPQTIAGSRVLTLASTENANAPLTFTWGASSGSAWNPGSLSDSYAVDVQTFATKTTTDLIGLRTDAHLTAGSGAGIVGGRVRAYIDGGTLHRGGTGLEVLIASAVSTVGGNGIFGMNVGVDMQVTSGAQMIGNEYDLSARGATIGGKFGVVVGSTQADVASVSGTLTVNGFADTVPQSAAYWTHAFAGGGATGFNAGILTVKETGGAAPITGRLWYSGGFSVPTGLDWGRMTFSTQAMLLPNNGPIRAYATDNTTIYSLLNLNLSNLIAFGGVATIDPSTGAIVAPSIKFGTDALSAYTASTAWTPADGSGAALAFTNVNGHYTRIGNMVFAYGRVTYPATGSGSSAVISGLPITSANASYATSPCTFYSSGGSTNALSASVGQNATTFSLTKADGSATTNANVTGATIVFQCIYPAT